MPCALGTGRFTEIKEKCKVCGTEKNKREYSFCPDCNKMACDRCMIKKEDGVSICSTCYEQYSFK